METATGRARGPPAYTVTRMGATRGTIILPYALGNSSKTSEKLSVIS